MSKAAFIGLGAMGSRMASNLIKAGYEVTVCDPNTQAVQHLVGQGAKEASTGREAASGNEFVIAMVRDDEISRTVWLDEKQGALGGMSPKAIAIECSTITPGWARELSEAAQEAGIAMLEAPVSGSTPQAESKELVFLVGGDKKVLARAESLLKAMGSRVQHAGSAGSGALAKLVTNTFMAVELATLAQMIEMLRAQGADAGDVLRAVAATPLWSPHMTPDVQSMLSGDFEPHFPINLLLKDLNYTVETAGGDAAVPTVAGVRDLFAAADEQKLGDLNMTAIFKLFEKGQR